MDNDMIRQKAVDTLKLESEAVAKLVSNVNDEFVKVVRCILDCPARVIVFDTDKLGASGEHKVKRFIDERTSTAEAVEVLHEAQQHAAEKTE